MRTNNEPAFPKAGGSYHGMTLRDYFAAQALTAIIFHYGVVVPSFAIDSNEGFEKRAEQSYRYADAMLAVRSVEASS